MWNKLQLLLCFSIQKNVLLNYSKISIALLIISLFPSTQGIAQPDLEVSKSSIESTLRVDYLSNNDQCYVNEGCVGGTGARQLLRFTTKISNIGNQDYYVGQAPADPSGANAQWEWDECHNHWHFEGYARYVIEDANGTELPASFKNGFCLMDISCTTGTAKFNCSNQGITAGCADIYSSGLDCQWIDVTDLPAGNYKLRVEVNWNQTPDYYGRTETDYSNNAAEVCFTLSRSGTQISFEALDCNDLTNGGGGTTTCNDSEYTLRFKLDNYPEETTYRVLNSAGNIVASGGPFGNYPDGSTIDEALCLPDGCYTLRIDDSYGDGICCGYGEGQYTLLDTDGSAVVSGGNFGSTISHQFCVESGGGGTGPVDPPTNEICPGNVLPDPSFETTGLTGWEVNGRVRIVQNAESGIYGARLNRGEAQMTYTVNVEGGDEIDFCGYFKVRRSPNTAIMGMEYLDQNFTRITFDYLDITSHNYTEYCLSTVAPASARFGRIIIYQNGPSSSRLFVDDVCLEGDISFRGDNNANALNVEAVGQERMVNVQWYTNTHKRVEEYILERSSNGIDFETIYNLRVGEQYNVPMNYQFKDVNSAKGTNYYRVKQIFAGDRFQWSGVHRLEYAIDLEKEGIVTFPNPAQEELLVDTRKYNGESGVLSVIDNLGQVIEQHKVDLNEDFYRLDLGNYRPGVYQLSIDLERRKTITDSFVVIKE